METKMSFPNVGASAKRRGERGVTLVSTMIGILVFSFATLAFFQLLTFEAAKAVIFDRQRQGLEIAAEKLNTLSSLTKTALPYGGSITPGASCQDGAGRFYCDRIVRAPRAGSVDPAPQVLAYGSPVPAGSTVVAVRRWLIEPIDDPNGLRKISVTIAVDDDAQPYLLRWTKAVVAP